MSTRHNDLLTYFEQYEPGGVSDAALVGAGRYLTLAKPFGTHGFRRTAVHDEDYDYFVLDDDVY